MNFDINNIILNEMYFGKTKNIFLFEQSIGFLLRILKTNKSSNDAYEDMKRQFNGDIPPYVTEYYAQQGIHFDGWEKIRKDFEIFKSGIEGKIKSFENYRTKVLQSNSLYLDNDTRDYEIEKINRMLMQISQHHKTMKSALLSQSRSNDKYDNLIIEIINIIEFMITYIWGFDKVYIVLGRNENINDIKNKEMPYLCTERLYFRGLVPLSDDSPDEVDVFVDRYNRYERVFQDDGNNKNKNIANKDLSSLRKIIIVNDDGIKFNLDKFAAAIILFIPDNIINCGLTSEELTALLLHEIGHSFYPILFSNNKIADNSRADEKFADKFSSLYGYNIPFISGLKKLNDITLYNVYIHYRQQGYNSKALYDALKSNKLYFKDEREMQKPEKNRSNSSTDPVFITKEMSRINEYLDILKQPSISKIEYQSYRKDLKNPNISARKKLTIQAKLKTLEHSIGEKRKIMEEKLNPIFANYFIKFQNLVKKDKKIDDIIIPNNSIINTKNRYILDFVKAFSIILSDIKNSNDKDYLMQDPNVDKRSEDFYKKYYQLMKLENKYQAELTNFNIYTNFFKNISNSKFSINNQLFPTLIKFLLVLKYPIVSFENAVKLYNEMIFLLYNLNFSLGEFLASDDHPLDYLRFQNQLKQLTFELKNPNVPNNKKQLILADIRELKKLIKNYENVELKKKDSSFNTEEEYKDYANYIKLVRKEKIDTLKELERERQSDYLGKSDPRYVASVIDHLYKHGKKK